MKILIADDNPISRRILQLAVEKFNHGCLVAEDGAQAWAVFRESGADVIISDWMMPGMDGLELCHHVRASETYTYFILLTARDDKESFLRGMRAGADDYLTKPFEQADLEGRLIAAARVTALHRQLAEQRAELEKLRQIAQEQARIDALTQLGNRLRLWEDIEKESEKADRYGESYCAAMIDVDHFKQYNDHYGHRAGDDALRIVARTIAQNCRGGDSAYRYGGEEFLLFLPKQKLSTAAVAIERIRATVQALQLPHAGNEPHGVVTISAGIAEYPFDGPTSLNTLIEHADRALYQAKAAGRNAVRPYLAAHLSSR